MPSFAIQPVTAEYRGARPGGTFTAADGVVRDYGPSYTFERQLENGDVELLRLKERDLDRAEGNVDVTRLERGALVRLHGRHGARQDGQAYLAIDCVERVAPAAA